MSTIRTIAFINNPISAALTQQDLALRGLALEETAVILGRQFDFPWLARCATAVRYPSKPRQSITGQWRFIGFYRAASALLRRAERAGTLRDIYIVNNDNLIASHLLHVAGRNPQVRVTAVAEGLMNFQQIERGNRADWRWRVKPFLGRALGLQYQEPLGHLSGAFDPEVDRLVSFASEGLKAPHGKIEVIPFPQVRPARDADPKVALVALTGLAQWMPPQRAKPFAKAFARWIDAQKFSRILVKHHPHSEAGAIGEYLPPHEVLDDTRSLENMAADLEAGTILGTCCTGLVTLKLMRPDIRCIDFGSDYYQVHAYGGDTSAETLLRAAGVEIVPMGDERTEDDALPSTDSGGPTKNVDARLQCSLHGQ